MKSVDQVLKCHVSVQLLEVDYCVELWLYEGYLSLRKQTLKNSYDKYHDIHGFKVVKKNLGDWGAGLTVRVLACTPET